ncbi:MAG: 30S ribosomal protein S6 [Acidobacteria bacterium]|nr:30S ribosomal protein S6 [Acidobacteriota bacterium]
MSEQSSPETAAPPAPDSLMNGYEFMFILDPTLDDAASLAVVERVEGIVKGQGGEIVSLKPWERRRLAYPIAGHHEGLYILCYFDAPPASIRGIESRVRLAEGVLRFIVLRTDKETRERDQAADLRRREERAARAAAAAAEAAARAAEEAADTAGHAAARPSAEGSGEPAAAAAEPSGEPAEAAAEPSGEPAEAAAEPSGVTAGKSDAPAEGGVGESGGDGEAAPADGSTQNEEEAS